jgi:hypothetical protein
VAQNNSHRHLSSQKNNGYKSEVENVGKTKGRSTLDATELELRNRVKQMQALKARCKRLAQQWSPSTGYGAYSTADARSLTYYWEGELDLELRWLQASRTHRNVDTFRAREQFRVND